MLARDGGRHIRRSGSYRGPGDCADFRRVQLDARGRDVLLDVLSFSSASAPTDSAIGTLGSGRWNWYRSIRSSRNLARLPSHVMGIDVGSGS
jgi:hypothetical protein